MPSHDVTLVRGVADSKVLTLIRSAGACCASVNVPGADDPINPAQLFSRDRSSWTALFGDSVRPPWSATSAVDAKWSKSYANTRDVDDSSLLVKALRAPHWTDVEGT